MGHILIIDDDEMLCEMLCRRIHDMEHKTTCAHNLSQGLKVASESPFDIVLLDVRLPDGNGLDLVRTIRQEGASFPVVVLTAFGSIPNAVSAMRDGANDYIEKPVDLDQLTFIIERNLEESR